MTVKEFLEVYDGKALDAYVDVLEYIPVKRQQEMYDQIMQKCTVVDNNVLHVDQVLIDVATFVCFLSTYTNLEFSDELYIDEYDALKEINVSLGSNLIFKYRAVQARVDKIINQRMSEYSLESTLKRAIADIQKAFVNSIKQFDVPADVNWGELMEFVQKYK